MIQAKIQFIFPTSVCVTHHVLFPQIPPWKHLLETAALSSFSEYSPKPATAWLLQSLAPFASETELFSP